jgi:hypothetical protein
MSNQQKTGLKTLKNAFLSSQGIKLIKGGAGIRTREYRFCKPIPENIKCFINNNLQILKNTTVTKIDTTKNSTLVLPTA